LAAQRLLADAIPAFGPPALRVYITYEDESLRQGVTFVDLLVWDESLQLRGDTLDKLNRTFFSGEGYDTLRFGHLDGYDIHRILPGVVSPDQMVFRQFSADSMQVIIVSAGSIFKSEIIPTHAHSPRIYLNLHVTREGIRVHRPFLGMPTRDYLIYLMATLLLEAFVYLIYKFIRGLSWKIMGVAVLVNLLTHLPIWLLVYNDLLLFWVAEALVILVEGLLVWLLLRKGNSLAGSLLVSLCANLLSMASIGVLLVFGVG
jgi:hypothetical protein